MLCWRRWWDEKLCPDPELRAVLNATLPLAITFNSGTDVKAGAGQHDHDAEGGIALRILRVFMAQQTGQAPDIEHMHKAAQGARFSVKEAVEYVLATLDGPAAASGPLAGRTSVLLLVDELVKLLNELPAEGSGGMMTKTKLVSLFGSVMDRMPAKRFNVCITTLDALYLNAASTQSGRTIAWAPLPRLGQATAEGLMRIALEGAPAARLQRPLREELPPGDTRKPEREVHPVPLLINDCSGHARSLEALMHGLRELREDQLDVGSVLRAMREKVARDSKVIQPEEWAVVAALEGRSLRLSAPVPGDQGGKSLAFHISAGAFINADATGTEVVPVLSIMQLYAFASSTSSDLQGPCEALLGVDAAVVTKDNKWSMGGPPFEQFMAQWLRLRLALERVRGRRTTTLQSLFRVRHDLGNHASLVRELFVTHADSDVTEVPMLRGGEREPVKIVGAAVDKAPPELALPTRAAEFAADGVYRILGSNAGFDILLLLPLADSNAGAPLAGGGARPGSAAVGSAPAPAPPQRMAVALEVRYSQPTSVVRWVPEEVARKRNELVAYAPLFKAPAMRVAEGPVFVFLADRDSEVGATPDERLDPVAQLQAERGMLRAAAKAGYIVMGRRLVASLLSPTLHERAIFAHPLPDDGTTAEPARSHVQAPAPFSS